ncbi:MAG TPA: hypothetical protein VM597_36895 [Gemmataceae bacterium]|nr:hypothetical protein [Gemmataceae bacterium]
MDGTGTIVAVGRATGTDSFECMAAARYLSVGPLDAAFGAGGRITVDGHPGMNWAAVTTDTGSARRVVVKTAYFLGCAADAAGAVFASPTRFRWPTS